MRDVGAMDQPSDMLQMADVLIKVSESIGATYVQRTGRTPAEIKDLMDSESWLSAKDCLNLGFATHVAEGQADTSARAMAQARRFKSLAQLHPPFELKEDEACDCECENCVAGDCDKCTNAECDDPNCKDCPIQAAPGYNNLNLHKRVAARLASDRIAVAAALTSKAPPDRAPRTTREAQRILDELNARVAASTATTEEEYPTVEEQRKLSDTLKAKRWLAALGLPVGRR